MLFRTENNLLDLMVKDFSNVTVNKGHVKLCFQDGLTRQAGLGELLDSNFRFLSTDPDHRPYSKRHLTRPWPASRIYEQLVNLFKFQPSGNLELIMYLNETFLPIIQHNWPYVAAANSDGLQMPYYNKNLVGSSKDAQITAAEQLDKHRENLRASLPGRSSMIDKRYRGFQSSPGWTRSQQSLFPVGYQSGTAGYGRLSSIPGTTLSNSKRTYKGRILETISQLSGLRFFEVDLKSCHLSIFRELYDFRPGDHELLPPQATLWPTLLDQFKEIHERLKSGPDQGWVFDKVDDLLQSGTSIPGLIKNQTYKSLNGGNPHRCGDNVKKSKQKLNIEDNQVEPLSDYLYKVFAQIGMFSLLINFMDQISAQTYLYLPQSTKPFRTATLSQQQGAMLRQNVAAILERGMALKGNTSNSRLFSSVEMCLILHVIESIVKVGLRWLVVGYEQDGLLIAVEEEVGDEDLIDDLFLLNSCFDENAKVLTNGNHTLELKLL